MLSKIFGFAKDKSMVETYSKEQIDELLDNVDTEIADGEITTAKIADKAITTDKVADGAITTDKLGIGSVDAFKIQEYAVLTRNLMFGSVTNDRIADGAVTGNKIPDGTIEGKHLANNTIYAMGTYTGNNYDEQNITIAENIDPNFILVIGSTSGAMGIVTHNQATAQFWNVDDQAFDFFSENRDLITADGFKATRALNNPNENYVAIAFR